MTNIPTNEDRVWAVIAHLSAIAFGMGILLPVIGWSEQRRKSKYASFQCLQALGYQSLGYTVWFLIYLLATFALVIVIFIAAARVAQKNVQFDQFMLGWMSFLFVFVFGMLGFYLLLPVIAAVSCALGREFRYPIMGNRLASYLGYNLERDSDAQTWLIEDHEDRWVAAMGHFSIIIALWGMLAPLTALLLQGKRSSFLKFQTIQALVYQGLATFLPFVAMFFYMFGFFIFIVITGLGENSSINTPSGIAGLVILLGSILIAAGMGLVIPLFHVVGQYVGYRVLKGDDYRYPLAGRLVEKWLSGKEMTSTLSPPGTAAGA